MWLTWRREKPFSHEMTGSRATRKRKSDAKDDQHVEDEVPISKESSKKRKQVENLNGAKRAKRGKLDSPSGEVDEELDLETSEGSQKSSKKRGSGGKGIDKENPFPNHLRPTEDESRVRTPLFYDSYGPKLDKITCKSFFSHFQRLKRKSREQVADAFWA